MKNFSTGSGGAIKSPFSSMGTTGPTKPSTNNLVSVKRNIDPASSHVPHKCPVPYFLRNKGKE